MKILKRIVIILMVLIIPTIILVGCDENQLDKDIKATQSVANNITENQPTPTDVNYSLERYNLIRRAYWINGQREKALALPCEITRPLGYVVLLASSGAVVGKFIVDGKVSYLNHWLTPIEWIIYNKSWSYERLELPDIDGCYGDNKDGVFFFTTDGKYIEWTGDYLYSDIPFTVDDPIIHYGE